MCIWLEYGKYENFPDFSLKKNEELKRGRKQNKLMKKHKISTLNYLANNFFLLLVQSHIAITIVTTKMPNIVPTIIQVKLLLLSRYDNALGCFVSPEMEQHTKYIIRDFFATPFSTWCTIPPGISKSCDREQGWSSGESTCVPTMWPQFKSRRPRHTSLSLLLAHFFAASFLSGYFGFPLRHFQIPIRQ